MRVVELVADDEHEEEEDEVADGERTPACVVGKRRRRRSRREGEHLRSGGHGRPRGCRGCSILYFFEFVHRAAARWVPPASGGERDHLSWKRLASVQIPH